MFLCTAVQQYSDVFCSVQTFLALRTQKINPSSLHSQEGVHRRRLSWRLLDDPEVHRPRLGYGRFSVAACRVHQALLR